MFAYTYSYPSHRVDGDARGVFADNDDYSAFLSATHS